MPTQTVFTRKVQPSVTRLVVDVDLSAGVASQLVAALASNQVIVTGVSLTLSSSTTLQFLSATTALTGTMSLTAFSQDSNLAGGVGVGTFNSVLETNVGEALNIKSPGTPHVAGWIDYYYDTVRS